MFNNKTLHLPVSLLIVLTLCFPGLSVSGETTELPFDDIAEIPALPVVLVEAQRIAPTTGATILDKELIEDLPSRNGSVNELIGNIPNVQYSEDYNFSLSGGEIFPPPVSISGSRFYDNNYTIDGLDNTSILNPGNNNYDYAYTLPGFPQKQFLNPRLIEEISVYNSNIPAEFGGFTGGQVNVKTIEPTPEFWGQLSYRTTNDAWTEFHIDNDDEEEFYAAESSENQPEFEKHDFGIILNAPVGEDTAFLTAYQKTLSKIAQNAVDGPITTLREKENILLKAHHYFNNSAEITLTGLYSPTHSSYFLNNHRHSKYTIDQENYSLNLQIKKDLAAGQWSIQAGPSVQQIKRNAQENRYVWDTNSEEPNREGGNGNLEYSEKEFSLKSGFEFNSRDIYKTNHKIAIGLETGLSTAAYLRDKSSTVYSNPVVSSETVCNPEDPACIEGDRYLSNRTTYNRADSSDSNQQFKLFIQDSIVFKRLEIFPGLRVSYDSTTDDVNLAPRFSTSLDFYGDGSTIFFAGRNIYYSSTLLEPGQYSYTTYTRDSSTQEWRIKSYNDFIKSKIKSPYTKETTLGMLQKLFGGDFKAQYIHKKSQDEFARTSIKTTDEETNITYNTYYLNNNGRSEYDSMLLSWQKSWAQHFIEINATRQISTTSNDLYTSSFDEEDLTETYWYEGKEYYKYEKPKGDFNRPTIINLIYQWEVSNSLSVTNTLKYKGKYWTLRYAGRQPSVINPDQAKDPIIYKKVKAKSAVTFDWSIQWRIPGFNDYEVVANLDILNVFNKRNKQGYLFNYYDLGRQFWLGVDVNF